MILIDRRIGSGELLPYFPRRLAMLADLEYGDFLFHGHGPAGAPWAVGVERKKLPDLLGDVGRFTGRQLPGLQTTCQSVWLVLEGPWRRGVPSGLVEIPCRGGWRPLRCGSRQYTSRELDGLLTTLTLRAGVHVRTTGSPVDTARWVLDLYRWFTGKLWDAHHAHETPVTVALARTPVTARVAGCLPGIGSTRALAVADYFGSPLAMALADQADWTNVDGIGKTTAAKAVRAMQLGEE